MASAPQPVNCRLPVRPPRACASCRLRHACLSAPQPIVLPRPQYPQWAAQLRRLLSSQRGEEEQA
uniref:Uncharacterized protein n=1 Tax=Thermogemmatispora argillosa TaxID=2045280 RepID=A0A455T6B1_9CHLR|nr:hypothetical protein KTA_14030 [Thermogemmatispora argillosa]